MTRRTTALSTRGLGRMNTVEQAFVKLMAGLRKAGARTRDALWATIGRLLDTFSPNGCSNYLANSGYASE